MVSSITESEWDDESRGLVVAEDIVRRMTGPNGEWMPDATSEAADPNAYSGYRYMAQGPFTNWAERAKADALDEYRKSMGEGANLHGVYFTAERFDY